MKTPNQPQTFSFRNENAKFPPPPTKIIKKKKKITFPGSQSGKPVVRKNTLQPREPRTSPHHESFLDELIGDSSFYDIPLSIQFPADNVQPAEERNNQPEDLDERVIMELSGTFFGMDFSPEKTIDPKLISSIPERQERPNPMEIENPPSNDQTNSNINCPKTPELYPFSESNVQEEIIREQPVNIPPTFDGGDGNNQPPEIPQSHQESLREDTNAKNDNNECSEREDVAMLENDTSNTVDEFVSPYLKELAGFLTESDITMCNSLLELKKDTEMGLGPIFRFSFNEECVSLGSLKDLLTKEISQKRIQPCVISRKEFTNSEIDFLEAFFDIINHHPDVLNSKDDVYIIKYLWELEQEGEGKYPGRIFVHGNDEDENKPYSSTIRSMNYFFSSWNHVFAQSSSKRFVEELKRIYFDFLSTKMNGERFSFVEISQHLRNGFNNFIDGMTLKSDFDHIYDQNGNNRLFSENKIVISSKNNPHDSLKNHPHYGILKVMIDTHTRYIPRSISREWIGKSRKKITIRTGDDLDIFINTLLCK